MNTLILHIDNDRRLATLRDQIQHALAKAYVEEPTHPRTFDFIRSMARESFGRLIYSAQQAYDRQWPEDDTDGFDAIRDEAQEHYVSLFFQAITDRRIDDLGENAGNVLARHFLAADRLHNAPNAKPAPSTHLAAGSVLERQLAETQEDVRSARSSLAKRIAARIIADGTLLKLEDRNPCVVQSALMAAIYQGMEDDA